LLLLMRKIMKRHCPSIDGTCRIIFSEYVT
jgi:hypothetical protein